MNYQHIYDQVYKDDPNYGDFNHGRDCLSFVKPYGFDRVLELGCGSGEWLKMLDPRVQVGIDISSSAASLNWDITRPMPFRDNAFDLVAAFDVLEHLELPDMCRVLIEIQRIAPRAIFSIGYSKSGHKHESIDELHRIIEPQSWWIKTIRDSGMEFNRILPPKYLCFGEW